MAKKSSPKKSNYPLSAPFEEVEHTADSALKIVGSNLAELLVNAARGMNSLMAAGSEAAAPLEEKNVELEAVDSESLLVEWLSELAFWAETDSLVFNDVELRSVSSTHLAATMRGRRVDRIEKHIKAVTYHNLEIVPAANGLTATVVFDV